MEFSGGHVTSAEGANRNPDGTFTVTGESAVSFEVTRLVGRKSWLTLADSSWFTGGSEYTITTAEQLAGLARLVNVEGLTLYGVTINLGSDISLANIDGTGGVRVWEAIGRNSVRVFSGTFDGQGQTIYNMTAWNSGSYAGLFGYTVGANIRNVIVRGTVESESRVSFAAGAVAFARGGVIENVVNHADVTAHGVGAGGVVANITGGANVINSVNHGHITGTTGVGGIVGVSDSRYDVISGSRNYGKITATGDGSHGTGGVAGQLSGLITDSGNFADITSTDRFTGGLVGYSVDRLGSRIVNSVSTGNVYSSSANRWAAVGSAVGSALFLEVENVLGHGEVTTGAGFVSGDIGGLIGHEGTVAHRGTLDESLHIAPIGYIAAWTQGYERTPITLPEALRPTFVRGGETIIQDGIYFIDPSTAGVITIADGLSVTLNGYFGASEDISVMAGADVSLTLQDVQMTGHKTLLTLGGGILALEGENIIRNYSEIRSNLTPTIRVLGDLTIEGSGSLYVRAPIGNVCILAEPSTTLELASGTLSLVKDGLLGIRGGAIYAIDATVIISGGVFNGRSNSDNVSVITAGELIITGGTIRAQAFMSPVALDADRLSITGGALYVYGHTGNSHAHHKAYIGAAAAPGASGDFFNDILPFTDVLVTESYYTGVRFAFESGYFGGITAYEFAPDAAMTRAMFVTVLHNMAGAPQPHIDEYTVQFYDISGYAWYFNAVMWAVTNGITSGTSSYTFSPNNYVTVEVAMVLLSRFFNHIGGDATPLDGDNGAGAANWARAAVAWAVENGMLRADEDFSAVATRGLLTKAISALRGL